MNIPIDKLYHYIERIANDVCGDNILIYRFYPHGSKKLESLTMLREATKPYELLVELYAHDQEPLNYQYYNELSLLLNFYGRDLFVANNVPIQNKNIRIGGGIYDLCILLHSELNSSEVEKYRCNGFAPAYYWCHGIIALDWFRYAKHEVINKDVKKTFLIYNRAWSGTREYRLKFLDLLIDNNLTDLCQSFFNVVEPQLEISYHEHKYKNSNLQPHNNLEGYFTESTASSSSSADYNLVDYNSTDFEVVLETLFDDSRIQLTEKILRPIALGQPFILASTKGSLEYLRSYGFRTFGSIIDESYDTISDPVVRLGAIIKTMKEISLWSKEERIEKIKLADQIAAYNRKLFFSSKFFNQVLDELKVNLQQAYCTVVETNTANKYLARRKKLYKYKDLHPLLLEKHSRDIQAAIVKEARKYYKRSL
jgi:hypothetical protein